MVLIIRFDFVVKHILKAPGHLCICCLGLRPMLCLKKSFSLWEELTSPMLVSSCVTSVRDNMRTWGGLPQILTSHHSLVLHSQPERPKDDCAGITQLLCFSLLSSFCSSRDILNLPSCEGFILPKPFWSQKSNLPILQPNALNNQMNFGVLHWLHQVPLVVKWYVNFDYFKILSDDPSHILASAPERQTANHLPTEYIQRNIDQLNHKIIMEN